MGPAAVAPGCGRRRDLVALAARLQDEEARRRDVDGDARRRPRAAMLSSGDGESSIERDRFVDLLADHLRAAPPAWDPFTPVG